MNWSHLDVSQLLALAVALGFASGIRLYALLFLIGLAGHLDWLTLPHALIVLQHPIIIGLAATLALVEFLADKIPAVDSLWDSVHTFVRLPAAAALAGSLGGDSAMISTSLALLGGSAAATSHFAKSGTRLALNASPEPVSNWAASFSEDAVTVGMFWLIFQYPIVSGIFALALLALCIWLICRSWRFLFRLFQKIRPT